MTAANIQIRRGTTSEWAARSTALAAGEFGWNRTTGEVKVGDGSTLFASLAVAFTIGDDATDTELAAAIATHSGATDPHGDREFAASAVGAEAALRQSGDAALDGRLDAIESVGPLASSASVTALADELGTNPSGSQATVAARLTALEGATPDAATTTAAGIVELATTAETTTGTDTVRAVTPAGVKAVRDALTPADITDAHTSASRITLPTGIAPPFKTITAPLAALAGMGEIMRLPRSRSITGTNNAGKVINILSHGDGPIIPNPLPTGQIYIGDPEMGYVTFLSTIDAGSGNVIDMRYCGNMEAALDTHLVQALDSTVSGYDTRVVGIATRAPGTTGYTFGTGIIERLQVNSGKALDATYVRVRNARFQIAATTGLTKVLQVFANDESTELAAIASTGHLSLRPTGASVNQIETYYGGSRSFIVSPDGSYLGMCENVAAAGVRVGAVGPGSQAAALFGTDCHLYREGSFRLALGTAVTLKTGRNVTASRPSAATVGAGAQFYDTTLGIPIWSDGSNWKNAAGSTV